MKSNQSQTTVDDLYLNQIKSLHDVVDHRHKNTIDNVNHCVKLSIADKLFITAIGIAIVVLAIVTYNNLVR